MACVYRTNNHIRTDRYSLAVAAGPGVEVGICLYALQRRVDCPICLESSDTTADTCEVRANFIKKRGDETVLLPDKFCI